MKLSPFFFWLTVLTLRWLSRLYFRGRCRGRENYPKSGPFIIALNHNSLMDIPAMALAVESPLFTMAKESLFRIPGVGWWLRSIGFFPVARGSGDRKAWTTAQTVLSKSGILAMAPEGTRKRNSAQRPKAHTGIVRLAQEFHCPIVPIGVIGARRALPPGALLPRPVKLEVCIGKPILLEALELSPENSEKFEQQAIFIMDRIYELAQESYPQEDHH